VGWCLILELVFDSEVSGRARRRASAVRRRAIRSVMAKRNHGLGAVSEGARSHVQVAREHQRLQQLRLDSAGQWGDSLICSG
jgi:hypothetical protein